MEVPLPNETPSRLHGGPRSQELHGASAKPPLSLCRSLSGSKGASTDPIFFHRGCKEAPWSPRRLHWLRGGSLHGDSTEFLFLPWRLHGGSRQSAEAPWRTLRRPNRGSSASVEAPWVSMTYIWSLHARRKWSLHGGLSELEPPRESMEPPRTPWRLRGLHGDSATKI